MNLHLKYGDEEHVFPLDTREDLIQLVEQFPRLRSSLYKGFHDVNAIAKDMTNYLSSNHMQSWIEE